MALGVAPACSVQQSALEDSAECTGPNCLDASAGDEDEDLGAQTVSTPDAAPSLTEDTDVVNTPSEDDMVDVCVGQCDLDDPLACRTLEIDPLAPREPFPASQYRLYQLLPGDAGEPPDGGSQSDELDATAGGGDTSSGGAASLADDAGADESGAALDASVTEGTAPAATIDAGAPLTEDASQPLNGRACRLAPAEVANGQMRFESTCQASGTSRTGAACTVSRDCAPGLACVGAVGQCRPFCCGGNDACGAEQFCTKQVLRIGEMSALEPPLVPVCTSFEACNLGEAFPCEEGMDCTCTAGRTCTVVHESGATGCVLPQGEGEQGDACPCAPGFLCSEGSRTCHRVCRTATDSTQGTDVPCGEAEVCVVNPVFPDGFGLCVGTSP